jgi:hypothetical protein
MGKTPSSLVGCSKLPAIAPDLSPVHPPTIHMSERPATLDERVRSATFHRHYYYWDMRKTFKDRGWAR